MSALGQKRTLELSRGMSALCQKQTSTVLLDHVVGNREQPRVFDDISREATGRAHLSLGQPSFP
jgi:hypothetical protein